MSKPRATVASTTIKFDKHQSHLRTRRPPMTSPHPATGGFTGDPAEALSVTGTSGCCGNQQRTTPAPAEPTATGAPCCGTQHEATAEGSCCGSAAKAGAVAAGQGCCG